MPGGRAALYIFLEFLYNGIKELLPAPAERHRGWNSAPVSWQQTVSQPPSRGC